MPITIEALSAPVTKKIAIRNTASAEVTAPSGKPLSVSNSAFSMPELTTPAMSLPSFSCRSNAAPPRMENRWVR
jgi:hypothetical protein